MREISMSRNSAYPVLISFIILWCSTMGAHAEMRVLESNVPTIVVGSVLPDSDNVVLPPGGEIRVLLLPSNKTKTFSGPPLAARSTPWGGTRKPIVKDRQPAPE